MPQVSEMAMPVDRRSREDGSHLLRPMQHERPAPLMSEVFRTMLKKHIHVAFKRRRLLTSLWPAIMYSIISIVLFRIFAQIDSGNIRALLLALTIPLYLLLAVQSALQNAMAEIVTEKESKMKIVQEIYGLTPTMYWLSWAGYFAIVSCLCVLAIYILLALVAPVMGKSSPIFVICLLDVCSAMFGHGMGRQLCSSVNLFPRQYILVLINGWFHPHLSKIPIQYTNSTVEKSSSTSISTLQVFWSFPTFSSSSSQPSSRSSSTSCKRPPQCLAL